MFSSLRPPERKYLILVIKEHQSCIITVKIKQPVTHYSNASALLDTEMFWLYYDLKSRLQGSFTFSLLMGFTLQAYGVITEL